MFITGKPCWPKLHFTKACFSSSWIRSIGREWELNYNDTPEMWWLKYCVADLCHSDLWIYGHISTGEVRHPKEHCRRVLGFQLAHPLRHPWRIPHNYHLLRGTPTLVRRLHRPNRSSGCLLPRSGDRPSHVPQGQHSFVYAITTKLCNPPSM